MFPRISLLILFALSIVPSIADAQSTNRRLQVAVLNFGDSDIGKLAAEKFTSNLRRNEDIFLLDGDQAYAAAKGVGYPGSLNMSLQDARALGAAIGCDYFFIGDAQTVRRSSSNALIYFESYASIFLVRARSGELLLWQRPSFQASTAEAANALLVAEISSGGFGRTYLIAIHRAGEDERIAREAPIDDSTPVLEAPDDQTIAAQKGLKLPRPFRRLQPAYPESAARAEAEATVDVLLDLDARGEVMHASVARWAGFGLDEATLETVRQLHFFPALRNGTPIPIRVLLRYNFRKPPK
jgi:TonB family protein